MLREMQRTARRENRTLSELVRENFRRAQQQSQLDVYQLIRHLAPPPPELLAMWDEATRQGTDKLTMGQIEREVRAVRRQRDKKATKRQRT